MHIKPSKYSNSQRMLTQNLQIISPCNFFFLISGSGKWVAERSLSEYADDSVVQGVSESHLNRPSGGSKTQKRDSPQVAAWGSHPGKDSNSFEVLL